MIKKIISGAQTGVDRAALDVAIEQGICYGGWCPQGRIDEKGTIPLKYAELLEVEGYFSTEKENYDARTKCNIASSDGTLILVPSTPLPKNIQDGTLLTIDETEHQKKPHLLIELSVSQEQNIQSIVAWVNAYQINTLNVAGPRESNAEGIYQQSFHLLMRMLAFLK